MQREIFVNYRIGNATRTFYIPNNCPHCGRTMSPISYDGFSQDSPSDTVTNIGILLRCSFTDCKKFFAIEFKKYGGSKYQLIEYTYRPPIQFSLPENIEKVSEKFVEIFTQSIKAESEKLNQIAGVGYRKSTEFLIKDYAILNHPDDKDTIENMFLGKVINTYLSDFPKLQNLAKASTWIGNDETHYVRRHEDKDINDMKAFILSAAQFIAADYDADVALNFLSRDKN